MEIRNLATSTILGLLLAGTASAQDTDTWVTIPARDAQHSKSRSQALKEAMDMRKTIRVDRFTSDSDGRIHWTTETVHVLDERPDDERGRSLSLDPDSDPYVLPPRR